MRYLIKAILLILLVSTTSFAWRAVVAAQERSREEQVSLKNNESIDLGPVYWISNCKSLLKSFGGIDLLEGLPEISVAIREEMVFARRQNCPNKIMGGTVVATAKDIKTRASGLLRYRVRYKTVDGERQSTHSARIFLYP